eukprot:TRINITY_DN5734_c0_g1_i1.p1 TRINITY_DN5734_c0_g1~~TRINITY_DN5734_c0_g1_i1.p1  ORF type:complete len:931 (+),score=354.79 TRINITY_DN5734_c0_g1_i1:216-3008(+)
MKPKELKRKKEKLAHLEKNLNELWKSLDRFLHVSKEFYGAQATFHEDLRRFYEEIPSEKGDKESNFEDQIKGSTSQLGILFTEQSKEERLRALSLIESLKMSTARVQKEYDSMFSVMKKRMNDSSTDSNLMEDFCIFEEQRHERFDPIFLILLRLNEMRSQFSLQSMWSKGAANNMDYASSQSRIQSSRPSIMDILNNTHGLNYFQTFVSKEFSTENVNFWISANQYRYINTIEGRRKKAMEIFERHFKENAQEPLNLDQGVSERVINRLEECDITLFDEAQRNILELMRADSFKRFLKDPLFKRLQNRLAKRDFSQHNPSASNASSPPLQKDASRVGTMKQRRPTILDEISLRDSEWESILGFGEFIQAAKGEALTYFSDSRKCLYKIVQGKVKMEGSGGHLFKLNEGEIFGEANFLNLNGSQFKYTSTDTRTEVARIDEAKILPFLIEDFKLAEKFYKMVCGQLAYHLYGISLKSVIAQYHDRSKTIVSGNEDSSEVLKARKYLAIPDSVPFHKDFECLLIRKGKTHGTLFVFETCVFFYARFFGLVTRIAVQLDGLKSVKQREKSLILNGGETKLILQFTDNSLSEVLALITRLWKKSSSTTQSTPTKRRNSIWRVPSKGDTDSFKEEETPVWEPIESDLWTPIFEVATTTTFKKGEIVLPKGDSNPKIYQILNGICSVEFTTGEKNTAVKMGRGDVFGEINYWYGGGATATILADQDGVVVYSVDRSVLEELFKKKPELSVKFFSFIANQIGNRLLDKDGSKYSHRNLQTSISTSVYPSIIKEKQEKEHTEVKDTQSTSILTQSQTERLLSPERKLITRKSSKLGWNKLTRNEEFQNSFPRRLTPPTPESTNEKVPPIHIPKPSGSDSNIPMAPRGDFDSFARRNSAEVGKELERIERQLKFGVKKSGSYDSSAGTGSSRNRSNSS